MKNLNVALKLKTDFKSNIIGLCFEADSKRYYALTSELRILESQFEGTGYKEIHTDVEASEHGILPLTREDVILCEFVVEIGSILLILKDGLFITIPISSSFESAGGSKYKHEKYIASAQLSPDQDLIAIADVADYVYILNTNNFKITHSANALTNNESLHKPVGVGWGSKETQFFGLDGRPSKESDSKGKTTLSPEELVFIMDIEVSELFKQIQLRRLRSTSVNWRGDGQLIATLSLIPQNQRHYLKVWNRNLELQYMSEQLVTMEGCLLSWIPNGQYICCAQQRDHCVNEIAMFEKNGLVHQRLTLPDILKNSYICDLSWSFDSKVLCIICAKFFKVDNTIARSYFILLYTMQNFHYYLKYTSRLEKADYYIVRWDPINLSRLYVSSSTGHCYEYECSFVVNYSRDHSTVAVVDSNKLLITPFSICNVPPPLSAIRFELKSLITRVIMNPVNVKHISIITVDNELFILPNPKIQINDKNLLCSENDIKVITCIENEALKRFSIDLGEFYCFTIDGNPCLQNLTPLSNHSIVATKQVVDYTEIHILEPHVSGKEKFLRDRVVKILKNRQVLSIISDNETSIFLLLDNLSCIELNIDDGFLYKEFSIASNSERLSLIGVDLMISSNQAIVTLTEDLTLRMNDTVIVPKCCTSFRISENFLVYTTTENNLHFMPNSMLLTSNLCDIESWSQPIEIGGTLVIVSESESKVILQMPRGNLEVLHPRLLVLFSIANLLDSQKYIIAMKEAKRHRLDMNFLLDYLILRNQGSFFSNILNEFVSNVVKYEPLLLNLLISELSNEDTLSSRYSTTMKFLPINLELDAPIIEQKVNRICSDINKDLLDIQQRILCYLKQEPKKIGEALREIYSLKNEESTNSAIKYMLYFIDMEQLLLDALATYDTDLALMVARVSTKDPKEYLALLDNFNAIEDPNLRRYKIDVHVKNYHSAFTNLLYNLCATSDANEVLKELLELLESKRLYKFAIRRIETVRASLTINEHVKRLDNFRDTLWVYYGDYLFDKRYHLEAGVAYCRVARNLNSDNNIYIKAMNCLLLCESWYRCKMLLIKGQDESSNKRFEERIIKMLLEKGKFSEALLFKQPFQDDELAHQLLEKGCWHLAYCTANAENISDLISSAVGTAMSDQYVIWKSEFNEAEVRFARLKSLISTYNQARRLNNLDGDNCFTSDNLSTVDGSEISSVAPVTINRGAATRSGAPSIETRISSKSQTPRAKKINLKRGSRYEDLALAMELKKFVSKQANDHKFATNMLSAHADFSNMSHLDFHKVLLENVLTKNLELAKKIQNQLWPSLEQEDQQFSLYKRFSETLISIEALDNIELEILQRPGVPTSVELFEL